jgi:hypothetical protein
LDPQVMQYAVYAGLLVAGYLIRHWFPTAAQNGAAPTTPATSPTPVVQPVLPVAPVVPANGIQIGHGELLNLILAALQQSGAPALPKPTVTPAVVKTGV